jgi:hypothetical protein
VTTTTTPTKAKALLLKDLMFAASERRLSTTAHAVLAHIIAEMWPHDDGWHASIPLGLLAWRLDCSIRSISRAVEEVASLLHVDRGDGRTPTSFLSPQGSHPRHPRGDIHVTPGVTPMSPMYRTAQEVPGAGGVSSERKKQQTPNELLDALRTRPTWLKSDQPWISPKTAEELAALAHVDKTSITYVRRLLDLRHHRLSNPAGYFVSQLRDPEVLDAALREMRRKSR